MADYYTQFSCTFDVGSPNNVARALTLYQHSPEDENDLAFTDGFALEPSHKAGSELWIHDDDRGDVEQVIRFALLCAEHFELKGRWGFEYANVCTKPRLDAFGGGAHVVDLGKRESVGWISTSDWLAAALAGGARDA